MNDLPHYTWDQATILGLATAQSFTAIGITPTTIRQWASRGLGPNNNKTKITAAGIAPGGAKLYPINQVTRLAEHAHRPPPKEHTP
jgi:hypothetical protein